MLTKMQLQRPAGLSRPLARRAVAGPAVARPSARTGAAAPAAPESSPALPLALLAAAAPLLLLPDAAHATGGAFGILEGRSAALVHPLVMSIQ